MITEGMSNRQLALALAVQAQGEFAKSRVDRTERLADQYYNYLETGVMGR